MIGLSMYAWQDSKENYENDDDDNNDNKKYCTHYSKWNSEGERPLHLTLKDDVTRL